MKCTVCHGYGFKRDGQPLSDANICDNCLGNNVCPKCNAPWTNDVGFDSICGCGWCWDDPANLETALQDTAMAILVSKVTGDPMPETISNPFIVDIQHGLQIEWQEASGEGLIATLYSNSFNAIFPREMREPTIIDVVGTNETIGQEAMRLGNYYWH